VDNGVLVDARLGAALRTSSSPATRRTVAGRPDWTTDARQHWVVAERRGQSVARTLLGSTQPFDDVPFFWSAHYDATFNYVGHATTWDAARLEGDPASRDCRVELSSKGTLLAVITLGRDRQSLEAEVALGRAPSG
jgi:3-phenylpropionate/trans-cinnamate dioxygenase ferredoxin reductase subunit